jgi:ketosteroid isomerase-like protein
MRRKLACFGFVVVCLALAAQNRDSNPASDRLLALETAWNEAELKHDTSALNWLLSDTFVYTDDDGSFMDKGQWLAHVRDGVDDYEQLATHGVTVHLYGDAAVVTGEYRAKIKIKGKSVPRNGRFTDAWIQQNGQWRCVASQSTLISQ